jgi:hypothetical protein
MAAKMNQLVAFTDRAPALVAAAGERASYRFLEFFTAQIRNPNTRRAYDARAAVELAPGGQYAAHHRQDFQRGRAWHCRDQQAARRK